MCTYVLMNPRSLLCAVDIHAAKPHKGQQLVAGRLRSVLHSDVFRSEIAGTCACTCMYTCTYICT